METERQIAERHRISAVRRDLDNINVKIDTVNTKLDALSFRLNPAQDTLHDTDITMDDRAKRLAALEKKNAVQSVKLDLLEKEINYVQVQNEAILENMRYYENESPTAVDRDAERSYAKDRMPEIMSYSRDGRHSSAHEPDKKDSENMVELDRNYARRPEIVPVCPDSNQRFTPGSRPDTQTKRYNCPSAQSGEDRHERQNNKDVDPWADKPDSRAKSREQREYEEIQRQRRAEFYGFHDCTAINPQRWEVKPKHNKLPWYDHNEKHSYPGGLVFLRFEDAAYNVVNLALKGQQSICRNEGGYLIGIARKERIFVYEEAKSNQSNWIISKHKPYKDCMTTENAVCVFWFTKMKAAEGFFEHTHRHNPFREPCFPSPREYEAFYIPLLSPPTEPLNTFFCIEFLNAMDYNDTNFTQFEAEVRDDMLRVFKDCLPMAVSSQSGRAILKPGSMISQNSKLFISRFNSQKDVDKIWELGMIQALRRKWSLTGSINVYSMSIELAG